MRRHIDYAFKSKVLNEHKDLLIQQKKCSLYEYSVTNLIDNGVIGFALGKEQNGYKPYSELYQYCIDNNLMSELKECVKINRAYYESTKRLKQRVRAMLDKGACLFLTLTFKDSDLVNYTDKQRRVAVTRFLKSYNCMYVANIDFGSTDEYVDDNGLAREATAREHYHAVIQCNKVNHSDWDTKFGHLSFERIRIKDIESDTTKLSKYVAKLSNHAIKESTKRSALIYSR